MKWLLPLQETKNLDVPQKLSDLRGTYQDTRPGRLGIADRSHNPLHLAGSLRLILSVEMAGQTTNLMYGLRK